MEKYNLFNSSNMNKYDITYIIINLAVVGFIWENKLPNCRPYSNMDVLVDKLINLVKQ
jgi:hypothetical protein